MKIGFTLCFIRHHQEILMLYRNNPPNQNKWNGVGGKIEPGELKEQACIREIKEETGLDVKKVHFCGIVTWNNSGGMYVFVADSPTKTVYPSSEGKLEWKSTEWVLSNPQVVSNIPLFLPQMLNFQEEPVHHAFTYDDKGEHITKYIVEQIMEPEKTSR